KMQPMIDSSVVFPLPDGPISNTTSPFETSRLTPCSTGTQFAPSLNIFVTPRTEIAAVIALSSPFEHHRWIQARYLINRDQGRTHAHKHGQKEQADPQLPRHQDGGSTVLTRMYHEEAENHRECIADHGTDCGLRDNDAIDVTVCCSHRFESSIFANVIHCGRIDRLGDYHDSYNES